MSHVPNAESNNEPAIVVKQEEEPAEESRPADDYDTPALVRRQQRRMVQ